MKYRLWVSMTAAAVLAAVFIGGLASVSGQTAQGGSAIARTPDGRPDFQGIWNYSTLTPLQRPTEFADKATLTAAEAAAYEKREVAARNADRRDNQSGAIVNGTEATSDVARAYNDFWWDRGTTMTGTKQTSLIIDPPDGRLPALTAEARKAAQERRERVERLAEGPEDRTTGDRCIHQQRTGPPMQPGGYNNHVQIFQAPELVAFATEQIHDFRLVPTDGRPHIGASISLWKGDSRARWDGDTLVVDTTNFNNKTAFQGASEKMQLVERFTLVDNKTLRYEFTVTDPAAFAKPWTASLTMERTAGPIYEYACHEGNYAMEGILRAARVLEKKADAATKGSR